MENSSKTGKKSLYIIFLMQNGLNFNRNSGPKVHFAAVLKEFRKLGHRASLLSLQLHRKVVERRQDDERLHEKTLGLSGNRLFILFEGAIRFIQNKLKLTYLGLFDSYRYKEACIRHFSDCDLFYERYTQMSFGGVWAASQLSKPLILEVHADSINVENLLSGRKLGPIQHKVAERITKLCFDRSTKIVVVSKVVRQRLIDYWNVPSEKIEVIPLGADVGLFNPDEIDDSELRNELGISGEKVIIFTGSFQAWHGTNILIEAFEKVEREVPNSRLILVGDGAIRQANERRVKELGLVDKVLFAGNVDHAEVPKYLKLAQVCVAPYEKLPTELWFSPLKIFEYMAMGKAVVASDAGQISEVLRHGESGFLIEPGNVGVLSSALIRLLTDNDLCHKLGENARERVLESYTWENHCRRLEYVMYSTYDEK